MAASKNLLASLGRDEVRGAMKEARKAWEEGDTSVALNLINTAFASVLDGPLDSAKTLVDRDQDYENDPGFTLDRLEKELELDRENKLPSYSGEDEGEPDAEHPIVKSLHDRIRDVIDAVEEEMGLHRELSARKGAEKNFDEDEPNVFKGELEEENDSLKDVFESRDKKKKKARKEEALEDVSVSKRRRTKAEDDEDNDNTIEREKEDADPDKEMAAKKHPKGCMCDKCVKARALGDDAEDPDAEDGDDDVGRFEKPMDGPDDGDDAGDVQEEEIEEHRRRAKKHGDARREKKKAEERRRKDEEDEESRERREKAARRRQKADLEEEMEVERQDKLPSEHFDDEDGEEFDTENDKTANLAEKHYRRLFEQEKARRQKAEKERDALRERTKKAERRAEKAEGALVKLYRQQVAMARLQRLAKAGVMIPEDRLDRTIAQLAYMSDTQFDDYATLLAENVQQAKAQRATASRRVALTTERLPGSMKNREDELKEIFAKLYSQH